MSSLRSTAVSAMFPERQSGLTVVGYYTHVHEAELARALLESEHIRAWVLDSHQIQMQWKLSLALGGVKVVVGDDDADWAERLLGHDGSRAVEQVPEFALPSAPEERCGACGCDRTSTTTEHVGCAPLDFLNWILLIPLGLLAAEKRVRVRAHCPNCQAVWVVE